MQVGEKENNTSASPFPFRPLSLNPLPAPPLSLSHHPSLWLYGKKGQS